MATPPNDEQGARPMNDSTLPPRRERVGRKQERLQKGFGLSDWVQLAQVSKDLAQRGGAGLRHITRDEIAQHDSIHDAWLIVNHKVYNVTPYLHYHPGGIAILKNTLGKDATLLFDKYHPWVNIDGLIGVLLLGYVDDSGREHEENNDNRSYLPPQTTKDGFAMPAPRPPKAVPPTMLLPKDNEENDELDVDPLDK